MTRQWICTLSTTTLLAVLPACGTSSDTDATSNEETAAREAERPHDIEVDTPSPGTKARTVLETPDGTPTGTVTFTEHDGLVQIDAEVHGVSPGKHGIHLHQIGDCGADDFSSAGGHFNPSDESHGAPTAAVHHAGDFGNIVVNSDGVGILTLRSDDLTVVSGSRSVVGKAVILHGRADDLTSQPSGAAGARIACGVVERIEPNDTAANY